MTSSMDVLCTNINSAVTQMMTTDTTDNFESTALQFDLSEGGEVLSSVFFVEVQFNDGMLNTYMLLKFWERQKNKFSIMPL